MEDIKSKKITESDKKNFYKFIKLLPSEYFDMGVEVDTFVEDFCSSLEILKALTFSDIEDEKVKLCFKSFLFDSNRDNYNIKTKEQLFNIKEIREDYYFEKIENTENINKIKNYIVKTFFNMDYDEFSARNSEISHVEERTFALSQDDFDEYHFVADICSRDTKDELLSYWDKLRYFCYEGASTYFERMSKSIKKIYQRDLTRDLTRIPEGFQIKSYKGEDFDFLVCDYRQISDGLKNSLNVNHINSSYMSVGFNSDYMFVFNNVKPKELVSRDEGWALNEDIEKTITLTSDKRVIKKKNKKKKFKPNGILCFDYVSDDAVEIARDLEIPVIVVERKYYASIMKEQLDDAFSSKRAEEYYYKKIQMFLSIKDNPDLVDKYFSVQVLEDEAIDFISNMDSSKTYNLNMLRAMFVANNKILEYSKEKSKINFKERNVKKILKNNRK